MEEDIKKYVVKVAKQLGLSEVQVVSGNEAEVIALIRHLPLLYDTSCFDFKNIEKKNAAWEAMSTVLDIPVGDLQMGWTTMKGTFRRHEWGKEDGTETTSEVPLWFEDMKFVLPFVKSRTRVDDCIAYDASGPKAFGSSFGPVLDNLTTKNTIDLIEDVRNHPVLYARIKTEGEIAEKARLWQHFAKKYHTTVEECSKVWKSLREKWSREHKAFVLTGVESTWPFYENTSFLKNYVGMRRTTTKKRKNAGRPSSNISTPQKSGIKRKIKQEQNSDDDDSSSFPSFEPEQDPISIELPEVTYGEVSSNTRSRSSKRKPQKHEEEEEDDPDTLFCKTINAELKKWPNGRLKLKLKREIFELLSEYAEKIEAEERD